MNVFNIKLTKSQLEWLGNLLGKQPYGEVVVLVNEINKQVQEQLQGASTDATHS